MDKILNEIRTRLTVDVWPTAGRALGYRTKGAAYAAARRGAMRVVEGEGRRKQVPTGWLKRVLCLDAPALTRQPTHKGRKSQRRKTTKRAAATATSNATA